MLDKKLTILLGMLSEREYSTASTLSNLIKVSERTVRNHLSILDDFLKKNGALIESKPYHGYRIVVTDDKLFKKVKTNILPKDEPFIPDNSEERELLLMAHFIVNREFITIDRLSELLFCSRSTLTTRLKKVESLFNKYDIKISRKPKYGLKIIGKEIDIRSCNVDLLLKNNHFYFGHENIKWNEISLITEILQEVFRTFSVQVSEFAFHNLVKTVYVMIKNVKEGYFIPEDELEISEEIFKADNGIADTIIMKLSKEVNVFPDTERKFLHVHLWSKGIFSKILVDQRNEVVPEYIKNLVNEMLLTTKMTFQLDFSKNLEIKLALYRHMLPFEFRIRYKMQQKNPMLNEIKNKYPFAYTIASQAVIPFNTVLDKKVSEDEISYIALIFELALQQDSKPPKKKNILLINPGSIGNTMLLVHQIKSEFPEYINEIFTSTGQTLDLINMETIDLIFTTIPLREYVSIPIVEITNLLGNEEVWKVKKSLAKEKKEFLLDYYNKDLFFTNIEGGDKETVILNMCNKISAIREVPEGFYDAVLKRENLAPTDLGFLTAIPHPHEVFTDQAIVSVGILSSPVRWSKQYVQVVFLVCLNRKNENVQRFYQATFGVMKDEVAIKNIIEKQSFEILVDYLKHTDS